jgi:hypothetical protein
MHTITPQLAEYVIAEHRAEAARIRRARQAQAGSRGPRVWLRRRAGALRPAVPRGRVHTPTPAR